MSKTIRWGIMGTGRIAGEFAEGLRHAPGCTLAAVASRRAETAESFAQRHQVPSAHSSYEALVNEPEVDAIYIATPHSMHCENTLLCLDGSKHVLCEKPFAINAAEVETMIHRAREKQCFLMEAMWMRFIPVIQKAIQWVQDGVIGEVQMVQADFGFRVPFQAEGRLFNPQLAGGALLDVGIYPIAFASLFLGNAQEIVSLPTMGATGVDEQSAYIMKYSSGALFVGSSAIRTHTSQSAWIYGTRGRIHFPNQFWKSQSFECHIDGKESQTVSLPYEGNGYQFEAMEVNHCLRSGLVESLIMPHAQSLALMQTMDAIRGQWGMRYPMEKS